MRRLIIVAGALLLAGCGKEVDLKPKEGASLPVKPATAATQPDASALLKVGPEAQPTREDELLTRSKPRTDDKFDLPPPG